MAGRGSGTRRPLGRFLGMAAAKHKTASRKAQKTKRASTRRWSAKVTRESHALSLRRGVFALDSPRQIAASLKRSAEESRARKADPYRSALSMLVFYMNRAGRSLPASRRKILERAKDELKTLFHKD